MKKAFKILAAVIIVFILAVGGVAFYLNQGLEAGSSLAIGTIDAAALADGIYKGSYDSGRWSNEVEVTVKDQKITEIVVTKDVTFPKPEWTEELFDNVIKKQNTDVDVISGATVTCKAYLKAIENALSK